MSKSSYSIDDLVFMHEDLDEVRDVWKEVYVDDVYGIESLRGRDISWIDIGCHYGCFVAKALDCTSGNILSVDKSELHADSAHVTFLDSHRCIIEESTIETSKDLLHAMHSIERMFSGIFELWLKIDIQGAELDIFDVQGRDDSLDDFMKSIDGIVMEWHSIEIDPVEILESHDFSIKSIKSHKDSLLGIDTKIISAYK